MPLTSFSDLPYILTYKSTARITRPPPQIFTPKSRKNSRPAYKLTPFFRFYMEIYFVARNEASVRQFNRRSISARSVLRSNQAATIDRPSTRMLAWQLQPLSPLPPPVARAVRVSRRPPVRRYQVASQIPAEMQLQSIVRCAHDLASMSAVAT